VDVRRIGEDLGGASARGVFAAREEKTVVLLHHRDVGPWGIEGEWRLGESPGKSHIDCDGAADEARRKRRRTAVRHGRAFGVERLKAQSSTRADRVDLEGQLE
jgi:hypothetical protein